MGFVLLGLMTLTQIGISGAVLQMFSHGIIACLLFAVVGRMVYDRTHTRQLPELEPMRLGRVVPFAAVTFTLASVASMGLPGFSGFVAEVQVLIGAWRSYPTLTVLAGAGILMGVAYALRALQKGFFGESEDRPVTEPSIEPISVPERIGAVLLLGVSLLIGLFPQILMQWIVPTLSSPLFLRLFKDLHPGGGA